METLFVGLKTIGLCQVVLIQCWSVCHRCLFTEFVSFSVCLKQVAILFNEQESVLKLSVSATCDSGEPNIHSYFN